MLDAYGTLYLNDTQTGAELARFDNLVAPAALTFTKDGTAILVGSTDGSVLVIEAAKPQSPPEGGFLGVRMYCHLSCCFLKIGIVIINDMGEQSGVHRTRLALLLAIPLLALAVRDWMLSPLVVLVGCLVLLWANFQAKQAGRVRVNEDSEMAALQLRALMRVDRSLLNALNKVELPVGVMRQAIEQVSSRLRMHQPPDQAAQALKGMPRTVTARMAALIAHSASLTDELQDALLLTLEQEAHCQKFKTIQTAPDPLVGQRHHLSVTDGGGRRDQFLCC